MPVFDHIEPHKLTLIPNLPSSNNCICFFFVAGLEEGSGQVDFGGQSRSTFTG